MDKLHKYAKKYCDGKIVTSSLGNSYYYHFNNGKFIVRISDHIGKNSDGKVSIIIDEKGYLLHNHSTGAVYIEDYENIKKFIRSLAVFSDLNMKMEAPNKSEIGELKVEASNLRQKVESLTKKNSQLGETNTRLNNEKVSYMNQVMSLKKESENLREEIRRNPLKLWLKLFVRHIKNKK